MCLLIRKQVEILLSPILRSLHFILVIFLWSLKPFLKKNLFQSLYHIFWNFLQKLNICDLFCKNNPFVLRFTWDSLTCVHVCGSSKMFNYFDVFFQTIESSWTLYHLFFDAYSVIWIAILLSCVILNIRSGFIPLHWVLFSSIGNIIRHSLFAKCKGNNFWKHVFFYFNNRYYFYRLEVAVLSFNGSEFAVCAIVLLVYWCFIFVHSRHGTRGCEP